LSDADRRELESVKQVITYTNNMRVELQNNPVLLADFNQHDASCMIEEAKYVLTRMSVCENNEEVKRMGDLLKQLESDKPLSEEQEKELSDVFFNNVTISDDTDPRGFFGGALMDVENPIENRERRLSDNSTNSIPGLEEMEVDPRVKGGKRGLSENGATTPTGAINKSQRGMDNPHASSLNPVSYGREPAQSRRLSSDGSANGDEERRVTRKQGMTPRAVDDVHLALMGDIQRKDATKMGTDPPSPGRLKMEGGEGGWDGILESAAVGGGALAAAIAGMTDDHQEREERDANEALRNTISTTRSGAQYNRVPNL
jgi:hypothetical protein